MHDVKRLSIYIDKINKLAELEAQKVFDMHQEEFDKIIKEEKLRNIELLTGNGTATYKMNHLKCRPTYYSNSPMSKNRDEFVDELASIQYLKQEASFKTKNYK